MAFLAFFLAAEFLIGALALGGSRDLRRFIPSALMTRAHAQTDDAPTPDAAPPPVEPGPEPALEPAPESAPENAADANPAPSEEQNAGSASNQAGEIIEAQPEGAASEANQQSQENTSSESASPAPESPAGEAPAENTVLPPEPIATMEDTETLTNAENIPESVVESQKAEDAALAAAPNPVEETGLLIGFADAKIEQIDALVENNDFASSEFLLQRFSDQINTALSRIGGLSEAESAPIRASLDQFADRADAAFRASQLTVPENLEQDFEIARGQLLNIRGLR